MDTRVCGRSSCDIILNMNQGACCVHATQSTINWQLALLQQGKAQGKRWTLLYRQGQPSSFMLLPPRARCARACNQSQNCRSTSARDAGRKGQQLPGLDPDAPAAGRPIPQTKLAQQPPVHCSCLQLAPLHCRYCTGCTPLPTLALHLRIHRVAAAGRGEEREGEGKAR